MNGTNESKPGCTYLHDPIPRQVIIGTFLAIVVTLFISSFRLTEPGRYEAVNEYCDSRDIEIKFGMGGILKYSQTINIHSTTEFIIRLEGYKPNIVYYDGTTGAFWFYDVGNRRTIYLWGIPK